MEQLVLQFQDVTPTTRRLAYSRLFFDLESEFVKTIDRIKKDAPQKPVIVIVPSNALKFHLKRRVKGCGIRFFNFKQFALKLAGNELHASRLKEIMPRGEELVAREALAASIKKGDPFYPFIDSPGLLNLFMSLIKDFRQGGFEEIPDITALLNSMAQNGGHDVNPRKLHTVFNVLNKYREGFKGKYYDVEDAFFRAIDCAERFNAIFRTDSLIFYGFYNIDQPQKQLIKAAANEADTTVFMPYLPDNPSSEKVLNFFKSAGFKCSGVRPASLDVTALASVRCGLFNRRQRPAPAADESVKILSCSTTTDEIKEIARRILSLAERGGRFDNIAVVLNDSKKYADQLMEIFRQAGIPVDLNEGRSLASTPEAKSLAMLLKLAAGSFSRFDVMEFFNSGNIDYDKILEPDNGASPAGWERLTRKAGIRKGYDNWINRLKRQKQSALYRLNKDPDADDCEKQQQTIADTDQLISVIKRLNNGIEALKPDRTNTWRDFSDRMVSLVDEFIIDTGSLEAVKSVIKKMSMLDALKSPVKFRQFTSFLQQEIINRAAPSRCGNSGCVRVYVGASVTGLAFDHLFVPGMVSGGFPRQFPGSSLVNDFERDVFNTTFDWKGRLPLKTDLEQREPLIFSIITGTAEKTLTLSYHRQAEDNKAQTVVSPYLLQVCTILNGGRVFPDELNEENTAQTPWFDYVVNSGDFLVEAINVNGSETPLDDSEYKEAGIWKCKRDDSDDLFMDLAVVSPQIKNALVNNYERNSQPHLTVYDGKIQSPQLLKQLCRFREENFSETTVSFFEEYHVCPYRFFLKRILGVQPLEDPEAIKVIQPKDRGNIYHNIYWKFYDMLKKKDLLPLRADKMEAAREGILKAAKEQFKKAEEEGVSGEDSSWFEKKSEITRGLDDFLFEEAKPTGFIPGEFEYAFDSAGIEVQPGVVYKYRGRIDRIDFSPDSAAVVVVDYKTGKSSGYKDNSLEGGVRLQLPLYLNSVLKSRAKNVEINQSKACYYFATPGGGFKKVVFDGRLWGDRKNDISRLLEGVLKGVENGWFPPYPGDAVTSRVGYNEGKNCRYCDYRPVCPVDILRIYRQKKGDPVVQEFEEMKEIN